MGGVIIELYNEKLEKVDEARLHEEHRHSLMPSTIGAVVRDLLGRNINDWREIKIRVL